MEIPCEEFDIDEIEFIVDVVLVLLMKWHTMTVEGETMVGECAPNAGVGYDVLVVTDDAEHYVVTKSFRNFAKEFAIIPYCKQTIGNDEIAFVCRFFNR